MNVICKNSRHGVVFLLAIIAVLSFSGCEKHVTPSKVERKLTVDGWQITNFLYQDTIVTGDFTNMIFGFGEEGDIVVIGQTGVTGAWTVGENKDPTVLYITGFIDYPFIKLNSSGFYS